MMYLHVASDMLRTVLDWRSLISAAVGLVVMQPTAKLRLQRKIYYSLPSK